MAEKKAKPSMYWNTLEEMSDAISWGFNTYTTYGKATRDAIVTLPPKPKNPKAIGDLRTSVDKDKCICQGKGIWIVADVPNPIPQYSADATGYIHTSEVPCFWHNLEARKSIRYPDGWEDEDLREWCDWNNLPEPEWLNRPQVNWPMHYVSKSHLTKIAFFKEDIVVKTPSKK